MDDTKFQWHGVALRLLLTFALIIGLMPSLQTAKAYATDSGSGQTEVTTPEQGSGSGTDGDQSGTEGSGESGTDGSGSTDGSGTGTGGTEGTGTEGSGTEGSGSTGTGETTEAVAKIGETTYTTLSDAMTNAKNGDTVTLLKDLTDVYGVVVEGKTVTLDMAGKTITSQYGDKFNTSDWSDTYKCRVIAVKQGGNLTIKGDGKIIGPADDADVNTQHDEVALLLVEGGTDSNGSGATLTIEDGEITTGICNDEKCGFYGIFPRNNGTLILGKSDGTGPTMTTGRSCVGGNNTMPKAFVTIYGGTYKCKKTVDKDTGQDKDKKEQTVIAATASGTIDIKCGTFEGTNIIVSRYKTTTQTINVSGGKFTSTNKDIARYEDSGQDETAKTATVAATTETTTDARKIEVSGGTFSKKLDAGMLAANFSLAENADGTFSATDEVCQIGETKYATLQAAIDAATDGQEIKLLKDLTDVYGVVVKGKKVTLNMDGKKITSDYGSGFSKTTESPGNRVIAVQEGGNLTIKGNGKIIGPQDYATENTTYDEKCLLLVEGGTDSNGSGATLTIEDGEITTGICNDEKCGFYGIFPRNNGTLILGKSDGTGPTMTTGRSCVGGNNTMPKAFVTIYGGTYKCKKTVDKDTGQDKDKKEQTVIAATASGTIDIKGGSFEGTHIVVTRYSTVSQNINITGGTFKSTDSDSTNAKEILKCNESGKTETGCTGNTVCVTGGTFSHQVEESLCGSGYKCESNSDDTYGIKATTPVAKIVKGDKTQEYASLPDAFNAALDGDTITMTQDQNEVYGINITDKSVTFDMGGKTIKSENPKKNSTATTTTAATTSEYTYSAAEKNWPRIFVVSGENSDLTITGNGTITGPTGENAKVLDSYQLIMVSDGATVTVENGTLTAGGVDNDGMYGIASFNGNIICGKEGETTGPTIKTWFAAVTSNNVKGSANITIYGGNYEEQAKPTTTPITSTWWHYFCAPVYVPSDGTVTISGGTFTGCYGVYSRYYGIDQTVTITGGDFKSVTEKTPIVKGEVKPKNPKEGVEKTVAVSGGTFKYELTADVVAANFTAVKNADGTYGVSNEVAQIGEKKYSTIQEAVNAAVDGDEITLLQDVIGVHGVEVKGGKNITLNMNGKTVSWTNLKSTAVEGDKTSGSKYDYDKASAENHPGDRIFTITGEGTSLTIKGNGTIQGPTGDAAKTLEWGSLICVDDKANLTVEDGKITSISSNQNDETAGMYGIFVKSNASLTLGTEGGTGPTIETQRAAIAENNTKPTATITVNSGTYKTNYTSTDESNKYEATAFLATASGDITINGGTFEAQNAFVSRYGNTSQNVSITGGTFTATEAGETIIKGTQSGSGDTGGTGNDIVVSGGTFSKKFDKTLLAPGLDFNENTGGTYGIKNATYTVKYFDGETELTDLTPTKYTYGEKTALPEIPEKVGYEKAGWYKTSDFTGDPITEVSDTELGNLTLYAKYTIIDYKITYENTKEATNENPETYNVNTETITLKPLTKEGLTFAGWVDAQGNKVESIAKGSTGELTLKATWTVTVKLNTLTGTGTVKFNDTDVKAADTIEVPEGQSVTVSWLSTKSGDRNLTLIKSILVGGVDQNATTKIDKKKWQVPNDAYREMMDDQTAEMTTYDQVAAVSQSITVDTANATGVIVVDVEFGEYVPVYRLYNQITSEHLFTTNKTEYDNFVKLCAEGKDVWIGEGIDWFAEVTPQTADANTIRRFYNAGLGALGHSSHYYSNNEAEIATLLQNGWVDDGADNYIQSGGNEAIWTCYNEALRSAHHYTSSKTEWEGLEIHGWALEKDKNGTTGVFKAVMSAKP